MATPAATTTSLAPSEIVLLNGERFTGYTKGFAKWNSAQFTLPASDVKARATDVGFAVLAAAVLGAARAGAIRLAVGEKKALLGLRKVRTVFVTPGDADPAWAPESLEARTRQLAVDASGNKKPFEVDGLVTALIAQDSTDPWHEAVERVCQGLLARGLLEVVQERRLKVFTVPRYKATPDALRLASAADAVADVERLLKATEADEPELWALLVKEVQEAVRRRTERDDDDLDFD